MLGLHHLMHPWTVRPCRLEMRVAEEAAVRGAQAALQALEVQPVQGAPLVQAAQAERWVWTWACLASNFAIHVTVTSRARPLANGHGVRWLTVGHLAF